MTCVGCTEFLIQGSGTVGSGSAFSYERVIIAEDPDNIPLVLLSVKALDKDDVLLVDQTPAWLEATTSGQSVLIGGKLVYRLTVTVEIDAVRILDPSAGDPSEWGEGTYTIELRAQVEDASKPVIVCLFDVCVSGGLTDLRAMAWAGFGSNDDVSAFDRVTGTPASNNPIAVDAFGLHGCDVDRSIDPSYVYYTSFETSNNSFLNRVLIDGSLASEENLVNVTNGQGAAVSDVAVDATNQIIWIAKTAHLIRVPVGPPWVQTSLRTDLSLDDHYDNNLVLAPDEIGARLFYGREESDADTGPSIYRINNLSPLNDTLIANKATINAIAGITADSELVALVFVAAVLSGLADDVLFALNEAGDCFRINSDGTGGVLVVAEGAWGDLGAGQNRVGFWSSIRYHDQENKLFMLAGRAATVKRIFVMALDATAQEIRLAVTDPGTSYLGFGFGSEIVTGS